MTTNQYESLPDEALQHTEELTDTVGSLLSSARASQGLTLEQVAERLHLRPSLVEEIEADNFSHIPSNTYVRGYVNNYAKLVDVDKKLISQCLDKQLVTTAAPAMQSFSRKTTQQARDSRWTIVTYIIFVVLLGLLVVWWVQKSSLLTEVDVSKPSVEEVAALDLDTAGALQSNQVEPIAANLNVDSGASPALETEAKTETSLDTPIQVNSTIAADSADKPVTPDSSDTTPATTVSPSVDTETAPATAQNAIAMTLTADCWMKITDANGKALVNGVRKAGSDIALNGTAPFKLVIGAPAAVSSLKFNGQSVDMAKFPNNRVARFSLPLAQ